jgi:hypothetical protein
MRRPWPTRGCCAMEEIKDRDMNYLKLLNSKHNGMHNFKVLEFILGQQKYLQN